MKFINSQYITADLTHLTSEEGYIGMKKNGIKIKDGGNTGLLYKPPGFFISVNHDWERWCISEDFRDVTKEMICRIYIKPNLTFIRIQTVEDADELIRFLLPDMNKDNPSYFVNTLKRLGLVGFTSHLSDLSNITSYQIDRLKQGLPTSPRTVWRNALNSCDGIYYENSMDLHFKTIFNTWDCDTLLLFDSRNIISLIKTETNE